MLLDTPMLNLARSSMDAQFSLLINTSRSFFDASLQLTKLQVQSGSRIMDRAAQAAQQGLRATSVAETPLLVAEHSSALLEEMRRYQESLQEIFANQRLTAGRPNRERQAGAREQNGAGENGAHQPQQHESEHKPSALVEKLVASVASETDKLRERE